jgi:hypothetical protein
MKMQVTTLQDAKATSIIGSPLDTEIVHLEFSREFTKHWDDLGLAQIKFINAIFAYGKTYSAAKRRKVGRLLEEFREAVRCSEAFASRLRDSTRSDQDNNERDMLGVFLVQEGAPFLECWERVLEKLDDGASLNMKQHVSLWMGEDPDGNWEKF